MSEQELHLPKYAVDALHRVSEVVATEHGYDYSKPLADAFDAKDYDRILKALRAALGQSKLEYSCTRWVDEFRESTRYTGDAIVNVYEMLQKFAEGDRAWARTLAANAQANYKRWLKTRPGGPIVQLPWRR